MLLAPGIMESVLGRLAILDVSTFILGNPLP